MLLEPDLLTPSLVLPAGAEFGGPLVRPVLARGGSPLPAVVLATLRASSASAASLAPPVALVGRDSLNAAVAVTRAQTPSGATSGQRSAGGAWEEVAANLPRFDGVARRLRVDAARTNLIADARTVGLTGWTLGAATTATTTGPDGGAATGTLLTETATNATHRAISATFSASLGVVYSVGFLAAAGSADLIQVGLTVARFGSDAFVNVRLSGDGVLERIGAAVSNARVRRSGDWYWITYDVPCTTAGAASILAALIISPTASHTTAHLGTTRTLRMAWAGITEGPHPGLPILPAVGSPASATRATDVPIWTPAAMPQRGAILLRGTVDAIGSTLGMLQLDNGTDTNRIVARISASGQPECLVVSGGVTTATLTPAGTVAANAEWRAILAWSPGGVRFGTTAGGVVSAAVARPAGLSRAVIGQGNAAGTQPLGGEISADLYDYWPSEAEALALLTA